MADYEKYGDIFKKQFSNFVDNELKQTLNAALVDIYEEKEREIEDLIDSGKLSPSRDITAKQVFPNAVV